MHHKHGHSHGTAGFPGFLGAALVTVMFAIVFLVIAYATPHWVSDDYHGYRINTGLWEVCRCVDIDQDDVDAWFRAVQVLIAIALFFLFMIAVFLIMALCIPVFHRYWYMSMIYTTAFMTAILLFITLVVAGVFFASDFDGDINYSYVFLVIAGAFAIIAVIALGFYLREMACGCDCYDGCEKCGKKAGHHEKSHEEKKGEEI